MWLSFVTKSNSLLLLGNVQMYLGFESISGNQVVVRNLTGTLVNVNALVDGIRGNGVYVNGADQYVEFAWPQESLFCVTLVCATRDSRLHSG